MQYKAIVLALLSQHPKVHQRLQETKNLIRAAETCGHRLKARHAFWLEELRRTDPRRDESHRSGCALEVATREFQEALKTDEASPSVDQVMDMLSRYTLGL